MSDLYDVDPSFAKDLLKSEWPVYRVASYFRRNGFTITMPPIVVRPRGGKVGDYSDQYDLMVEAEDVKLFVEIKQRSLRFSSLKSFPFSTVIVDAAVHYDKLIQKPDFHFLLNKDCSVALVAPKPNQITTWQRKSIYSDGRGRARDYYLAPKSSLFVLPM